MTQEEKAKAYDEALERAKMYQGMTVLPAESMIETIFPELAESEDELTWLTKYIEEETYNLSIDIRDNEDRIKLKKLQKALAWLEKQGEQKPYGQRKECLDCQFNYAGECKGSCAIKRGEQKSVLDIEIHFGAKDSELQEATYLIPEGFHAEIKDNEVLIKKGKQAPAWTDAFIEKACDAYCAICDTKECGYTGECVWVEKFRKRLMKKL